jgi:hypothetical protein
MPYPPITALPVAPSRSLAPELFVVAADAFLGALPQFRTDQNALAQWEQDTAVAVTESAAAAAASANFKGLWTALTGALAVPSTVYHLGSYWQLMSGIADVTAKVPGTATEWKVLTIDGGTPVGTITAWMGGYFTGAANAGFTNVLGNTVALANARLNVSNWYVCDGTPLNMVGSPIFNGAGRYLPNLTDSRFIQGSTAAGSIGGANAMAHTHTGPSHSHTTAALTLLLTQIPNHDHYIYGTDAGDSSINNRAVMGPVNNEILVPCAAVGGALSHSHGNTGADGTGNTGAASNAENRPLFLSCLYIMKVA